MSYNNGYGYSPGYQQTTGHSQNTQRQQQAYAPTADQSTTSHARYGDGTSATNQQDSRGGYGYTPRSSIDTTALGNLAHASSLGQDSHHARGPRDSSSLQQLINYNRSQQSQTYDGSLAYGTSNSSYGYGQQLSDSREIASSTRDDYSRSQYQPQNQGQSSAAHQYSQYATTAGYGSPTTAYTTSSEASQPSIAQSSYQTSGEDQRHKAQQYYSQPVRPTSGQSYRTTDQSSRFSPQASQSPTLSTHRATTASSNLSIPKAYSTQRPAYGHNPSSQQPPYAESRLSNLAGQTADKRHSSSASTASKPSDQHPSSSTLDSELPQQSPVVRPNSETQKSLEEQIPKTVDPSHVFNHYEYQRRQTAAAAAEAERRRKVAEAEETRKATEAAAALKRVSESQVQQLPDSASSIPASASKEKEEQMAAEMRMMIEKMRDYKSKDPALFSQIWEQVKKTQPAGSTPTIPPLVAKDLSGPSVIQQSHVNGTTVSDTRQIISLSPGVNQSVGVTAETSGELPDLGEFPAQRRRRGPNKVDGLGRKSQGTKKLKVSSPQLNGSRSSPLIDPALTQTSSSMPVQRSPYAIPANSDRQVVYVSGTGPQPESQEVPSTPASSSAPSRPLEAFALSSTQGTPTPAPIQSSTSGGTAWPEHKKWDLAIAAKNTLLASPINAAKAKNITPEEILGFLNQNPSFEQLCRMIEAKGLIIERSHFARSLLGAIPDIGASVRQRQQNAIANGLPPTSLQTPATERANSGVSVPQLNGRGFGVLSREPSSVPHYSKGKPQPNGIPTAQMATSNAQVASTAQPAQSDNEKPAVPLTKLEMARKRDISELVDLSQLSDDDLPPTPSKIAKMDVQTHMADGSRPLAAGQQETTNEAYGPLQQNNLTQSSSYPYFNSLFRDPSLPHKTPYEPLVPYRSSLPYQSLPPYMPPPEHQKRPVPPREPHPPSHSAQQRDLINMEDIVHPIDKLKAKKRKRYNPKTIVRDVLIAAGRHPTMQPLNFHLEPLRKVFKHVSDVSDLSTFRWDLVDPGVPPTIGSVAVGVRPVDTADGNDADDEGQDDVPPSAVQGNLEAGTSVSVATATHVPRKLIGPDQMIYRTPNAKFLYQVFHILPSSSAHNAEEYPRYLIGLSRPIGLSRRLTTHG